MAAGAGAVRLCPSRAVGSVSAGALLLPVNADGHTEISTAAGVSDFVEATRLLPGDVAAARG